MCILSVPDATESRHKPTHVVLCSISDAIKVERDTAAKSGDQDPRDQVSI